MVKMEFGEVWLRFFVCACGEAHSPLCFPVNMKPFFFVVLACLTATSLSSCAAAGSLVKSVLRVPGSLLNSVTDGDTPDMTKGQPLPGQPEEGGAPEVMVVVTPLEAR